ncbi:serine-arginine protein 55 [Trichonephila clavata]|uniref:Serine-arginine protein 55 n=1 Tax=Trichonephila clavata TaxID=2740835 RepID=A0A8X6KA11_TRICU|nr:serine-arginine protein 55 [Trichonephila clavata]
MTFGLRNAAQSFQRFLDSLFRYLPYCFVYIDDILIASRYLDEHISHLKEIFQRLTENGLVLKISKCIFAKPEVDFLGHVSASGIRPTTEHIQAILDFNRPRTVKQLRRFLGMLNFYPCLLPNAAKHQTKLNDFLVGIKKNKNELIDWDEDSIKAFEYYKEQLSESTTLAHPVSNAHLAIMVDVSDNAVGGVMQQYVSNHWQPLAFFSMRLTPTRKRYGPPTRTEYRLIVENLSSKVSWQDLKDFMRQAGDVTYADAHKQRRNEGVVEFATYEDMRNAYHKLDNAELSGRKIHLIEDRPRHRRSRSRSSSRSYSRSRSSHSRNRSRSPRHSASYGSRKSRSRSESKSRSRSYSRSRSPVKSRSPPRKIKENSRSKSRGKSASRSPKNPEIKSEEKD